MSGFIKIDRDFFKHKLWEEKRRFSPAEAWIDLLALARFEIEPETVLVKLKNIKIRRGELRGSIRFLAHRWGRSVGWTSKYLNWLRKEVMIASKREHSETIIIILNYNRFNPLLPTSREHLERQIMNAGEYALRSESDQQEIQTKESKELKESKEFLINIKKEMDLKKLEEAGIETDSYLLRTAKQVEEKLRERMFLEPAAMNAGITLEQAENFIPKFIHFIGLDEETNYRPISKHKIHFSHWIAKQKTNGNKHNGKSKATLSDLDFSNEED